MKITIVAGEPSGDLLGASLIKSLKKMHPDSQFTGVGGPAMIAEGFQSLYEMESLSVMGLFEPIKHLPELIKIRRDLYQHCLKHKPDVFIGIDSPDFNLGLELKLRKAGIRTVHYVSPSVWAWRKRRVFKIKKAVDLMLTLFPFEAAFYQAHHVPVRFVGHPLADTIPLESNKTSARKKLGLNLEDTYIALLPGSRRSELRYLAETFIATAYCSFKKRPQLKFITAAANAKRNAEFQQYCRELAPSLPIQFFVGDSHDVISAADAVIVTSGTATLETMLLKRPMLIVYKTSALTYKIACWILTIKFIGLPNLLANEKFVPEFIQDDAHPEKLSAALFDYLDHPEKVAALQKRFLELHQQLRCQASEQAAQAIIKLCCKED